MKKLSLLVVLFVTATFLAYSHDDCEPINSPNKKTLTITVATPGTLSQQLADYYKTEITELTIIGNLNAKDISMLRNLPNLAVLDMENANLEALPTDAFFLTESLTSVKLPKTLKTIGERAFYSCRRLTSVTIPDSVTVIYYYAFANCSGLTSVTIPDSVTWIAGRAFGNCNGLKSVTIGDGVSSIADGAFADCTRLTKVTIGKSVKTIGCGAFEDCGSLTCIYCKAIVPPSVASGALDGVDIMLTLYVPTGRKAAYAVANGWEKFRIVETQF